jgi:hypothetical protein
MPRDPDKWPILREYKYPSGKSVWMVDCGLTQINGKPKRERYFYELKKEAETKRDLFRTQRENEGQASFELTPAERDEAKAALEISLTASICGKPPGFTLRTWTSSDLRGLCRTSSKNCLKLKSRTAEATDTFGISGCD